MTTKRLKCDCNKISRGRKKLAAAAIGAVIAAAACAAPVMPFGRLMQVNAAAKVSMAASKKLKVGQIYTLKLKNGADWKIKKATTDHKKIVSITGKSSKSVKVSAKAAGWSKVTVQLKNSRSKKVKTLKCHILVTAGEQTGQMVSASTQEELEAALKFKDTEQITISSTSETVYRIPAGIYSNVSLIAKAKKAHIINNATFKSVDIQDVDGDSTWEENAKGNSLRVSSTVSKIIINKKAQVSGISYEKEGADTQLQVMGHVSKVDVLAKTKLNISGSPASVLPIDIKPAADGTELLSGVRMEVTVAAKHTKITLNKGAEESTIKAIAVKVQVINASDGNVTIEDANGKGALGPAKEVITADQPGNGDTGGVDINHTMFVDVMGQFLFNAVEYESSWEKESMPIRSHGIRFLDSIDKDGISVNEAAIVFSGGFDIVNNIFPGVYSNANGGDTDIDAERRYNGTKVLVSGYLEKIEDFQTTMPEGEGVCYCPNGPYRFAATSIEIIN